MCFLKKKSCNREATDSLTPLPSWDEIVDIMYDKDLDNRNDEVVQVMYSPDRTKRFMILKSDGGYYKYCFEVLQAFDDDEWKYICEQPGALPAMWVQPAGNQGLSLFSGIKEVTDAVKALPEYELYFNSLL